MLREEDEVQEMRDLAAEAACIRHKSLTGMSYEEGVRDALEWILGVYGDGKEPPIEKERYGL